MNDVEHRQLIEALISEIQIYEEKQANGQWLKFITFKLPIIDEDLNISLDNDEQVETVALLSKLNTEHHLDIEIAEDELSEIDFSKDATYREIKKYVLDKYGLKVSSLYIAQVKRKYGLIERENYNTSKNKNQRVPKFKTQKINSWCAA